MTDHNGSVLELLYHDDGDLRQIVQWGGQNADGTPLGHRGWTFYNEAGSSTRITLANEPRGLHGTWFAYRDDGRLASRRNRGDLGTVGVGYDTTARVTTVTDALGHPTRYTWDRQGKVTRIVNAKEQAFRLHWSADRHVTRVVEPTGKYSEFAYDDNGYLTDEWDQLRNHTKLEYDHLPVDANDRSGRWAEGRTQAHISQLRAKTDPKGTATWRPADDFQWKFVHDDRGNLVRVTDPLGFVATNTWNRDGTLASTRDENGHETRYVSYDANGLPTAIVEPNGATTRFGYDGDGLLRWVQDPRHAKESGGTTEQQREYRTVFEYDSFHRLGRQSTPKNDVPGQFGGETLIWTKVEYDANDNVLAEYAPAEGRSATETQGTTFAAGPVTTYAYDAMDQPSVLEVPHDPDSSRPELRRKRTQYRFDHAGRLERTCSRRGSAPRATTTTPSGTSTTSSTASSARSGFHRPAARRGGRTTATTSRATCAGSRPRGRTSPRPRRAAPPRRALPRTRRSSGTTRRTGSSRTSTARGTSAAAPTTRTATSPRRRTRRARRPGARTTSAATSSRSRSRSATGGH